MKRTTPLFLGLFLLCNISLIHADNINWVTDWIIEQADSLASGTCVQNTTQINVSYTGHINHISQASYFNEGSPPPYTGNEVIDNAPISGITLSAANTANPDFANRISFSSPVKDPLMALYSVGAGSNGVPYEFDQPFTLLSEGQGNWGDGSYTINGDTLTGYEFHGAIQFHGMVSSIAWNNPVAEYHHGFAIGVIDSVSITSIPDNYLTKEFKLEQNYPNPFNPATRISYQLASPSKIRLEIFDILGKKVATLVDDYQTTGTYSVAWDASSSNGGVYFCKLLTNKGFSQTIKLILLK